MLSETQHTDRQIETAENLHLEPTKGKDDENLNTDVLDLMAIQELERPKDRVVSVA